MTLQVESVAKATLPVRLKRQDPFIIQPEKLRGPSIYTFNPEPGGHDLTDPYAFAPRRRRVKVVRDHASRRFEASQSHTDLSDSCALMGPLSNPAQQIRLLQILPGREHRRLRLGLSTWDLDKVPSYYAISYAWGDSGASKVLFIEKRPFFVRENCFYAIWQARLHAPGCHIWIDAICINQDDAWEKSAQVQIMSTIYSKASHVLACIGSHSEDSESLIELAREIGHPVKFFQDAKICPREDAGRNLGFRWEAWIHSRSEVSFYRACEAYRSFANRPYWTRLWIVQEIVLAPVVTILCGEDILPWTTIMMMDEMLRVAPEKLKLLPRKSLASRSLANLQWASYRLTFYEPIEGIQLLADFAKYKCTDPRDRVFGLLAFTDWGPQIEVDYSKSAFDLVMKLAESVDFNLFRIVLEALEITSEHEQIKNITAKQDDATLSTQTFDTCDDLWRTTGANGQICQITRTSTGVLTASLERPHDYPLSYERSQMIRSGLFEFASDPATTMMPQQLCIQDELAALLCHEARADDFLIPMFSRFGLGESYFVLRHRCGPYFNIVGRAITVNGYNIKKRNDILQCTPEKHWDHTVHRADIVVNLSSEDGIALAAIESKKKAGYDIASYHSRLTARISMHPWPTAHITNVRCPDDESTKAEPISDSVLSHIYNVDLRRSAFAD